MFAAIEKAKKANDENLSGMIDFKEGNVMQIKLEGINLQKFDIKGPKVQMTISKLEFVVHYCSVGKQNRQVFRKLFDEEKLLRETDILKGQTIYIENVDAGAEIKMSINIVPKSEEEKRVSKREIYRPLGAAGSLYLSQFSGKILNNKEMKANIKVCTKEISVDFKVTQNQLTKQPSRVIEVCFHRFIRLDAENDFVKCHGDPKLQEKEPNNIKMLLVEEPCIQKLNEITRLQDIVQIDENEQGGTNQLEEIVKGSINDMIRQQTKEEQKIAT